VTVTPEQITDSGAGTATTTWQRWSTSMQIVVTDPDSLAVARREVDAELDTIEAAADAPAVTGSVPAPAPAPGDQQ